MVHTLITFFVSLLVRNMCVIYYVTSPECLFRNEVRGQAPDISDNKKTNSVSAKSMISQPKETGKFVW